jgi:DNA-binding GntR family transcriptional regulator
MKPREPQRLLDGGLPKSDRPHGVNATRFVHDYLKDLILDLSLEPGTVVTEVDVVEATGLSRTPVREALLRLHEEQLVELLPRRGAMVPWITSRQVRDLYEMRYLLETRAIEIICEQQIPVAAALLRTCDEQESLNRAGASPTTLIRVDRQFHSLLVEVAGNEVMNRVYQSLGDLNQRTGVLSFTLEPHRCQGAVDQHREIAEALGDFDIAKAREIVERHLVAGGRQVELLIAASPAAGSRGQTQSHTIGTASN